MNTWKNWSGSVTCHPQHIVTPQTLEELTHLVQTAAEQGQKIRVVGSGHSFTPVVHTNGLLVSLDKWQGVEQVDHEKRLVTVRAGTKLSQLGRLLAELGFAQENMGDIDVQSIAGAISTGTHGTGVNLPTIAAQVAGLKMLTGRGELVSWDEQTAGDLLNAGRVSLGLLGLIVSVTLRVLPAYQLHLVSQPAALNDVLSHLTTHQQNRHFEFFWLPHSEVVQLKLMNQTELPPAEPGLWARFNDTVLENQVVKLMCEVCSRWPSQTGRVNNLAGKLMSKVEKIGRSHHIFASERSVKFHEMEYNIPAAAFVDCLTELKQRIAHKWPNIHFPIECRFVRQDNIWLSPAYQRESAYIAIHVYQGQAYEPFFRDAEELFKSYHGRPHWGKMHYLTPADVHHLYPKAADFLALRHTLDPHNCFVNEHLQQTFAL